jgi:hypothetical protein
MPRLSFPFVADGLLVTSLIALSTSEAKTHQAQGSPVPPPVRARGALDSGCTVTAVAPWVLKTLNATPGQSGSTQTASGKVPVTFYKVSFTIYQLPGPGTDLSRIEWEVLSLAEDLPDVDVLFGLDLLREIVLTIDGPGARFTLDF